MYLLSDPVFLFSVVRPKFVQRIWGSNQTIQQNSIVSASLFYASASIQTKQICKSSSDVLSWHRFRPAPKSAVQMVWEPSLLGFFWTEPLLIFEALTLGVDGCTSIAPRGSEKGFPAPWSRIIYLLPYISAPPDAGLVSNRSQTVPWSLVCAFMLRKKTQMWQQCTFDNTDIIKKKSYKEL